MDGDFFHMVRIRQGYVATKAVGITVLAITIPIGAEVLTFKLIFTREQLARLGFVDWLGIKLFRLRWGGLNFRGGGNLVLGRHGFGHADLARTGRAGSEKKCH